MHLDSIYLFTSYGCELKGIREGVTLDGLTSYGIDYLLLLLLLFMIILACTSLEHCFVSA